MHYTISFGLSKQHINEQQETLFGLVYSSGGIDPIKIATRYPRNESFVLEYGLIVEP